MDSRRGFFVKLAALVPVVIKPTTLQPSDLYTPINTIVDVPSGVCMTYCYTASAELQNADAFRKSLGLGESK